MKINKFQIIFLCLWTALVCAVIYFVRNIQDSSIPPSAKSAVASQLPQDTPEVYDFYFYYPPDVLKQIERLYQNNEDKEIYEVDLTRFYAHAERTTDLTVHLKNPKSAKIESVTYRVHEDYFEDKKTNDRTNLSLKYKSPSQDQKLSLSDIRLIDFNALFKNSEKIIAQFENKSVNEIGVKFYRMGISRRSVDDHEISCIIHVQTDKRSYFLTLNQGGAIIGFMMSSSGKQTAGETEMNQLKSNGLDYY